MITYTFHDVETKPDLQPDGRQLWWVVTGGKILAYCDTKQEAAQVRDELKAVIKLYVGEAESIDETEMPEIHIEVES